jgi:tRNA(Ile)-lysidine synthase
MNDPLIQRLRQTIADHRLWPSGARLIVAVSGGKDSVALVHALATQPQARAARLRIAHLDHALRPESRDDAEFIRQLSAGLRVPAVVERRDVAARCAEHGWSLEDGARRVRYELLVEFARRYGASYIATAHTADDQAETVLMRLVRGAGLAGLSAMPYSRTLEPGLHLVRPMLDCWRADVDGYVARHRLTTREDATNADEAFLRNRIRRRLLPLLEREYNPGVKQLLVQLADQCRHDAAYLQEAAGRQWRRVAGPGQQIRIGVKAFRRQPKALQRQLVREAVERARGRAGRLEFRHWREVEELFADRPVGTTVDLPGGVVLERGAEHVRCRRNPSPA